VMADTDNYKKMNIPEDFKQTLLEEGNMMVIDQSGTTSLN
jgi:hypothetical protein